MARALDACSAAVQSQAERSVRPGPQSRLRIEIEGVVQGVGFRPFVYRLAKRFRLAGWARNDPRGVVVEVEGSAEAIGGFREALVAQPPPRAHLDSVRTAWVPSVSESGFTIVESEWGSAPSVPLLSDAATCGECLDEVRTPGNRRYRYPFTNCTNCGPRYSIVRSLPYDRSRTTMEGFPLCARCDAEYRDPFDRRFHAQPLACPECGPNLILRAGDGSVLASGDEALREAGQALRGGRIVAVKGLGGFQLMVDATREEAVARLRARKRRFEKPLALMVRDALQARSLCAVSSQAETALSSPEAPIVILPRLSESRVAPSVAPGSPDLGLMLPTTPLHHLLLHEAEGPVVATSGNLSEEPICTDEAEALTRLGGIADLFLLHDRPIARHVDDSVAWVFRGELRLLRRARGFAPLPIPSSTELPPLLGAGTHLKNAVALGMGRRVMLSQHVGDLETPETVAAFERVIADLLRLYDARPAAVAHDLHPDYASTLWALASGLPPISVQHHHAHLAACLADNGAEGPALGVTWDGAGYGPDGTIWGGEFLTGTAAEATRFARLAPFPLPGGDAAAREPRRSALGLLWGAGGEELLQDTSLAPVRAFTSRERSVLAQALRAPGLCPLTSSAGRLFDGIAALLDLRQRSTFEGQAAMALEWAVDEEERGAYPLPLLERERGTSTPRWELEWRPLLQAVLEDLRRGVSTRRMAARFHNALVAGIVSVARLTGERRVALTGGCFLNRRLATRVADRLEGAGYTVLQHRQVPPGDGGIALGQVMVAAARLRGEPGRLR
jgi:hydrogenase maturation protein HypF